MPFQQARPEVAASARESTSSSAAQRFYSADQAATYTTPANASIQRDLTVYALELVHTLGAIPTSNAEAVVLLDLGAGSALSTRAASQWLHSREIDHYCVAFDISVSMLSLTQTDPKISENHHHASDFAAFYCGNAAQKFPLRDGSCTAAIGISMLQWLTNEGLRTCYDNLHRVLMDGSAAVFQIYPTSVDQVIAMETIALEAGFAFAEVFVSFPHSTTAKKWYLSLKKKPDASALKKSFTLDGRDQELCPFGRRSQRRCAWHLLKDSSSADHDTSSHELKQRLGREHVKEAWHVWRKYHRSTTAEAATSSTEKPLHHLAKRSLELWKSDELIGEALRKRFLRPSSNDSEPAATAVDAALASTTPTITYNFLLSHMDEVVRILHTAYSEAVAIERSLINPPTSTSDGV